MRRFADLFDRLGVEALPPRFPSVALEITPARVTGVRLALDRKSGKRRLEAVESRDLFEGAIEVSLTKPNIQQPDAVRLVVEQILKALAPRDHRVSLLLPDDVARVALLGFAALPKTRRELVDLVRFRMAKSLPFKPEEAVLDLMVLEGGAPAGTAVSVLAAFVHRGVLEQYESLVTASGHWPGLVSLSTFELYNLFRPHLAKSRAAERDSLILNVTPHYLSVVILRDADVIFYRCKPHSNTDGDSLTDVRRELYTSLAFYQEKLLGRGIGRVFLRCAGLPVGPIREVAGAETGGEVEILDPLSIVPPNGGPALGAEDAAQAAPAIGAVAGRMS